MTNINSRIILNEVKKPEMTMDELIDKLDSFLEMRIAAEVAELRADFDALKKDLETIHAMSTLKAAIELAPAVVVNGPEFNRMDRMPLYNPSVLAAIKESK